MEEDKSKMTLLAMKSYKMYRRLSPTNSQKQWKELCLGGQRHEKDSCMRELDLERLQPYDPTMAEQTWPSIEELEAQKKDAASKPRHKSRGGGKIPAPGEAGAGAGGDEDAEMGDEEDEEQMADEGSEDGASVAPSGMAGTEDHWDVSSNMTMEVPTSEVIAAEKRRREVLLQRSEEELEFPDEVDTPLEVPARERFQRYRGLKSFRTSSWDPYEDLPVEYSRIWEFEAFGSTVVAFCKGNFRKGKGESQGHFTKALSQWPPLPCLLDLQRQVEEDISDPPLSRRFLCQALDLAPLLAREGVQLRQLLLALCWIPYKSAAVDTRFTMRHRLLSRQMHLAQDSQWTDMFAQTQVQLHHLHEEQLAAESVAPPLPDTCSVADLYLQKMHQVLSTSFANFMNPDRTRTLQPSPPSDEFHAVVQNKWQHWKIMRSLHTVTLSTLFQAWR
eukprot:s436_g55.t1